jgi:hypothetical protein
MSRLLRKMGKVVSQSLLPDESVCIACSKPLSKTHIGFQTVLNIRAPEFDREVDKGFMSPDWRMYTLRVAKAQISAGIDCQKVTYQWLGHDLYKIL